MRRLGWKWAVGAGLLASSSVALACTDIGCETSWNLFSGSYSCANRIAVGPGNDSRVNLLLLASDSAGQGLAATAYPKAEWEEEGFGQVFLDWRMLQNAIAPLPEDAERGYSVVMSRCDHLDAGAVAFNEALGAAQGISAEEKSALTAARGQIGQGCKSDAAAVQWPTAIKSPAGWAFLGYLRASDAFYAENWDDARNGFAALRGAKEPWVAETAAYMLVRVEMGASQAKALDEYGYYTGLKGIDQAAVARAAKALGEYRKAYPQGRYAASAAGFERRILWLAGSFDALGKQYEGMLTARPVQDAQGLELVQEIDNKFLFNPDIEKPHGGGPMVLAAADLVAMRTVIDESGEVFEKPKLTADDLASQQLAFATRPDLYAFVQANHAFYVAKDYRRVLQLLPDDSHRPTYTPLAFSRQVLRGQALAALGDRNEAGFWHDLLGGAKGLWQRPLVELGLALNYERHGRLADVFAAGSPVMRFELRDILLTHSAGAGLLRQMADGGASSQERDRALYLLLYKQLSRGLYADFLGDLGRVPANAAWPGGEGTEAAQAALFTKGKVSDGFACGALGSTARTLASNAADPRALLCLGEFWRLNGYDGPQEQDRNPPAADLGGAVHEFAWAPLTRGAIYARVLANKAVAGEERAYALYRSVMCYAPSGYDGCGGADVPVSQRKAWFNQLKAQFPTSPWAKKLRYYW
jgi:hypothetical protein